MASQDRFLVWGAEGWIGGQIIQLLKQQGKQVKGTTVRMHEQQQVRDLLDQYQPTHVINCAGKTGRPNVDWCESNKLETMESNGLGTHLLTYECNKRDIHCTVLATGCMTLTNRPHIDFRPDTYLSQVSTPPNTTRRETRC